MRGGSYVYCATFQKRANSVYDLRRRTIIFGEFTGVRTLSLRNASLYRFATLNKSNLTHINL